MTHPLRPQPCPHAGNGVGALAPRGRGLCMWLCVTAASFVVNGYFYGLINRLAPLPLGGGAGAGAGVPPPEAPPSGAAGAEVQQPGFLMVGQQVHPAAAMAWAAAAAAQAAGAPEAGQQLADGAAELGAQPPVEAEADAAAGPEEPQPAEAAQQADAGVQAGGPGAAEPPVPAPQQRRVVGGPRLPDRPARRNAAVGPGPAGGAAAAAAGAGDRGAPPPQVRPWARLGWPAGCCLPSEATHRLHAACSGCQAYLPCAGTHRSSPPLPTHPPPQAPHTPLYRDQRAPTPAGDSEEAEARNAAAASPGATPSPAAASPGDGTGPSRSRAEGAGGGGAAGQE